MVCAVGLGWVGKKLDETRREQVVVAKIESWWGFVYYHEINGPPWITRHFRSVQWADLFDTHVTDAGLVHLNELTKLEGLRLSFTDVTDAGLVHVKELTTLRGLEINCTEVTDAGLVHLKGLSSLEGLWLKGTQVTDAGLVHLKDLTKLEQLDLSDTNVTDEGVKKLQKALPNCDIGY